MATITAPGASVARNTVQTIPWAGITRPVQVGERSDWYGLYLPAALDAEPIAWQYTDGTAAGSGSLFIPDGLALTTYELRLFSGHTQAKLATSATFTLTAGTPTTLTIPATASANTEITATWAAIADPKVTDYIELREASLQTLASDPVLTGGTAAGSAPLYIPNDTPAGTYRAYLWRAAIPAYGLAATALALSGTIEVDTESVVSLTASRDGVAIGTPEAPATAGDLIDVTYAGIVDPQATDYIGIHFQGPAVNPPLAWRRTDGSAANTLQFRLPASLATNTWALRLNREPTADPEVLASLAFVVLALE
jgi:hypothetical protein